MERKAKAVFVGEVVGWHEATREDLRQHSAPFVFRMRVDRYWKGVKTHEVTISAMGVLLPGCCDIALKEGEKYLVYAVGKSMSTGCSRTRHLEQAGEDLKALGPGKPFSN
jgi:hypothetical protein